MIAIISKEDDSSTCDVIDWLLHAGKEVIRINAEDALTNITIHINDCNHLSCMAQWGGKLIDFSKLTAFWFRRGFLPFKIAIKQNVNTNVLSKIEKHLSEECETVIDFLVHLFDRSHSLGNYYKGNANKLISLYTATQVGLKIPQTFITTDKQPLVHFYENNAPCISKFIQDVLTFTTTDCRYFTTTSRVAIEDVEEMGELFFPSQLQIEIPKRYELRIFYLDRKCYGMAIFSQEDERTHVDFRNYNYVTPNRTVPYKLPVEIENKLIQFMDKMQLDTGSIDMILTPDMEYVFLEVNPVGQYDMVSVPCNYYLHKEIAKYLINER
jgi:ATP-GRASP peptide maturase of grasp-with-spasm system